MIRSHWTAQNIIGKERQIIDVVPHQQVVAIKITTILSSNYLKVRRAMI